jgi:hypothetical protein
VNLPRRDQHPFRGVLAVGVLLVALLASGCATSVRTQPTPPVANVDLSPVAIELSPREAWRRAEAFAEAHPGSRVMVGRGGSMLPQYEDRTLLVVQTMEQADLRLGMTVVFHGDSGRPVAHTLIERCPAGWVAMGAGNREPDRTAVRYSNYIGTVIGAFVPGAEMPEPAVLAIPVSLVAAVE